MPNRTLQENIGLYQSSECTNSMSPSSPPPLSPVSPPSNLNNDLPLHRMDNPKHEFDSNPFMKKASSLCNLETQLSPPGRSQLHSSKEEPISAADKLVDSCAEYLDKSRTIDIKIKREGSLQDNEIKKKESVVRFIPVVLEDDYYSKTDSKSTLRTPLTNPKKCNKADSEKLDRPFERNSVSYGTLPHALKKQQKHVRSLIVPKMRKMFEKSKSAEPEGYLAPPSRKIKLKIQVDPPKSPSSHANDQNSNHHQDGTESVSSFVALNKNLLDVVDNKRKLFAGERGKSASFSSNGDEWSISEEFDRSSENDGVLVKPRSKNNDSPSQSHQEQNLNNDNIWQHVSSTDPRKFKNPTLDNEACINITPDSNSSESNENDVNVLNNKSFVNKCVSKVKNLVNSKQSSPQPGQ